MQISPIKPRKALNKAYLKVKPNRSEIEQFKKNLTQLLDQVNETESEEWHKNLVSDFLKNTYYKPDHYINTKGRTDLVIHNGKDAKSSVGVIIETKKPTNKVEMLSEGNLNAKALHELILYFLRERITQKNLDIKYLAVTNIYEWYIFDANLFEKVFAQNKELVKRFNDFNEKRLSGTTTDYFYDEIAKPIVDKMLSDESKSGKYEYTHFDIREYEKALRNNNKADDTKLIALYKLLAPEHLLKLPFANDSNSLDKSFYAELLHIIGLTETKEGSKKVIGRKKEGSRNTGSLIENAIIQLDSMDIISRMDNPSHFGESHDERLYNVALELAITWVNRILFLKLLEAQMISYHHGDKAYSFLNHKKVHNYDDLNSLFFSVLARKHSNRIDSVKDLFSHVPYLNSSLFEVSDIENKTIVISNLRDEIKLPISSGTVLKDSNGKKRTGELNALEYFFEFLNAYDFSSEGSEEIQEDNKALINASVLGLIFEKINGYKDGSFFTPGFITMYMCRESIRRAVVQKFNDLNGWKCKTLDDLYNKIENPKEANDIINSLKICDPAVGSGHFLVSALNEIIAIKSDLKILQDRNGRRLKEYHVEVVNDELIISDEDNEFFEYHPKNKESQRIQETLFHEKQTIIENCLFGVDLNPNSVKICRLRLWIELLKNAYYVQKEAIENSSPVCYAESAELREGYELPTIGQLQTLPNIDINIKCGNSLISRFDLDANISQALKKSKWTIDSYRAAVQTYREASSKEQKREMEQLIEDIKKDFESEISKNDSRVVRFNTARGKLFNLTNQQSLFGMSGKEKKEWQKQVDKLTATVKKLETEIEEIKSNKIYENAFEWRFEFPEVLDENGNFVGFDVVIGNPPYIRQEEFSNSKPYLQSQYETFAGTADLFVYFVERGLKIAKQGAQFVYILPNKWMRAGYGLNLRKWIKNHEIISILDFGDLPVFEEATTYPCIWFISKQSSKSNLFNAAQVRTLQFPTGIDNYIQQNLIEVDQDLLPETGWTLVDDKVQRLLEKIKNAGIPLGEYVKGKIYRGVLTGLNEAFIIDTETRKRLIQEDPKCEEIIKPFLAGRDIKRYQQPESDKYLIFTRRGIDMEKYPSVLKYLSQFKEKLEPKPKDHKGDSWKGRKSGSYKWYEIQDAVDYFEEFETQKIVWPETSLDNQFCYVMGGVFLNKTSFFIPTKDEFLLGLLNSKLAKFYFDSIVSKMRGGYFSMSKAYVETFNIKSNQSISVKIGAKVSQILEAKKRNNKSDISGLEAAIDSLIYSLYGLSHEEEKLIEGRKL